MEFFTQAVNVLKILVMAVGAGLGAWGVINLMEGYGNDNPGAKSQGIKQLMAGGGIVLIGLKLIPLLANVLKSEEKEKLNVWNILQDRGVFQRSSTGRYPSKLRVHVS